MSFLKTLRQARAERAWKQLEARLADSKQSKTLPDYLIFARKFPTMIHQCGLAQALAFANQKASSAYKEDLSKTITAANSFPQLLLEALTTNSISRYAMLTRETLDAATWIKRFAEATIKPKKSQTKEPENASALMP